MRCVERCHPYARGQTESAVYAPGISLTGHSRFFTLHRMGAPLKVYYDACMWTLYTVQDANGSAALTSMRKKKKKYLSRIRLKRDI